ncbi:rod shape-determining protein MreD [Pseudomonas ogarae]|nr:rod shape-determining protein MreD [Pseudomonas ogarae]
MLAVPLLASAEEIGQVSTVFKFVGPNDRIVVEAFDDPKVDGVTCYLSRAKTGGVKGGLGLAEDVLYGTLLGQNALILTLITFLVLSLQQRLRMFPMWQQCLVILVIFGLAQLVQLWLSALTGNRQPTLALVLPALVSALLWPWVSFGLRGLRLRFKIN